MNWLERDVEGRIKSIIACIKTRVSTQHGIIGHTNKLLVLDIKVSLLSEDKQNVWFDFIFKQTFQIIREILYCANCGIIFQPDLLD